MEQELKKFKNFWHSIMGHFHKRICYDKDENYKIVSDDLDTSEQNKVTLYFFNTIRYR